MKTKHCLPLLAVLLLCSLGCKHLAERQAERDLEMVARRWCMTIRASQVIPVYPLNEDIQPGDVFVVDTPAQRQASDYNKRGYLELEHLLVRLNPANYDKFYSTGYGIATNSNPPRHWQFPASSAWSNAPLAAFPSYSIDIKKGGGFNAAFPISGIPVGLSLLDNAQAAVTVQLSKGHSFGLDQATLETPFRAWLSTNADILAQYTRPTNGQRTAYLRLITRVFLVQAVNVTLTGDDSTSFTGSGGAAKSVLLKPLEKTNTVANYTNAIGTLEKMVETLSENTPGGTLKLASASSRSISLNETFDRPLVIGYIAQDYPVLPDGRLGSPVSTRDVLERRVPDPLELTAARIRSEQDAAEFVADQSAARVRRLSDPLLSKALDFALVNQIVSPQERARIDQQLAQNREAGLKAFANLLARKAGSGDVRSRCDLYAFLDALNHLQP